MNITEKKFKYWKEVIAIVFMVGSFFAGKLIDSGEKKAEDKQLKLDNVNLKAENAELKKIIYSVKEEVTSTTLKLDLYISNDGEDKKEIKEQVNNIYNLLIDVNKRIPK